MNIISHSDTSNRWSKGYPRSIKRMHKRSKI